MKKLKPSLLKFILLFTVYCLLFTGLWGCATYKFQRGSLPYNKGYVASRDDYVILEYTVGKDNTVPTLKLAKQRFKERQKIVEHYYKKMGLIENHFKMACWDPCIFFLKIVGGVFRLPFVAISDYRYEHNPKYKEKIKAREAKQDAREEAQIKKLKEELNVYIQKFLAKETSIAEQATIVESVAPVAEPPQEVAKPVEQKVEEPIKEVPIPIVEQKAEEPAEQPPITQIVPVEEKPVEIPPKPQEVTTEAPKKIAKEKVVPKPKKKEVLAEGIQAIIIAKPIKGYSPLKVRFNGQRSHSPYGKIVSYQWEFGDGDTSPKPNPVNTYWSTTYGSVNFTATLTVTDDKGNTATASEVIEAITK